MESADEKLATAMTALVVSAPRPETTEEEVRRKNGPRREEIKEELKYNAIYLKAAKRDKETHLRQRPRWYAYIDLFETMDDIDKCKAERKGLHEEREALAQRERDAARMAERHTELRVLIAAYTPILAQLSEGTEARRVLAAKMHSYETEDAAICHNLADIDSIACDLCVAIAQDGPAPILQLATQNLALRGAAPALADAESPEE